MWGWPATSGGYEELASGLAGREAAFGAFREPAAMIDEEKNATVCGLVMFKCSGRARPDGVTESRQIGCI
jgi:hypothetical protein